MRPLPHLSILIAVGAVLSGCATPQDPANAPVPLPIADRIGVADIPHSGVIASTGSATPAAGEVGRGEALLRFPYRYRHTAVLTEDVTGYSMTVSGVQAPSGAPGYYAGTFAATGTYGPSASGELWCFLPGVVGGERRHLCFLKSQPGIAAIAPTRMNPWLWTQFAPATGSFDYVNTPIYERREVAIPGDLTVEYRFRGWSASAARLTEYAGGREVRDFDLPRQPGGEAVLRTVAGDFVVRPAPGDAEKAVVGTR